MVLSKDCWQKKVALILTSTDEKTQFVLCVIVVVKQTNRYEIDISNEVLNIDFGQGDAKIPEVKAGVGKKYLPTRLTLGTWVRTGLIGRYFFQTPTLTSGIFAAP